jgi:hypothetical protein
MIAHDFDRKAFNLMHLWRPPSWILPFHCHSLPSQDSLVVLSHSSKSPSTARRTLTGLTWPVSRQPLRRERPFRYKPHGAPIPDAGYASGVAILAARSVRAARNVLCGSRISGVVPIW